MSDDRFTCIARCPKCGLELRRAEDVPVDDRLAVTVAAAGIRFDHAHDGLKAGHVIEWYRQTVAGLQRLPDPPCP